MSRKKKKKDNDDDKEAWPNRRVNPRHFVQPQTMTSCHLHLKHGCRPCSSPVIRRQKNRLVVSHKTTTASTAPLQRTVSVAPPPVDPPLVNNPSVVVAAASVPVLDAMTTTTTTTVTAPGSTPVSAASTPVTTVRRIVPPSPTLVALPQQAQRHPPSPHHAEGMVMPSQVRASSYAKVLLHRHGSGNSRPTSRRASKDMIPSTPPQPMQTPILAARSITAPHNVHIPKLNLVHLAAATTPAAANHERKMPIPEPAAGGGGGGASPPSSSSPVLTNRSVMPLRGGRRGSVSYTVTADDAAVLSCMSPRLPPLQLTPAVVAAATPAQRPQVMMATTAQALAAAPFIGFVAAGATRWLISGLHFDRDATVRLQTPAASANVTLQTRVLSSNIIVCDLPPAAIRNQLMDQSSSLGKCDVADVIVSNPDSQSAVLRHELNLADWSNPVSRGPFKDVHQLAFLPLTAASTSQTGTAFDVIVMCMCNGLPATNLPPGVAIDLAWVASTDTFDLLTHMAGTFMTSDLRRELKTLGTAPVIAGCAIFPGVKWDTSGEYMFVATAVNLRDGFGDVPVARSNVLCVNQ